MSAADSLRPARKRRRADINIVPLIDVLVVLIFFFLVSMQFRNLTLLQLVLPEVESAGESQQTDYVEISVTKEGTFFINGEEVDETGLEARLERVAEVDKSTPILVSADEASMLRDTAAIMDICRKLELESLSLQTR